jgi:hypothetical protein
MFVASARTCSGACSQSLARMSSADLRAVGTGGVCGVADVDQRVLPNRPPESEINSKVC